MGSAGWLGCGGGGVRGRGRGREGSAGIKTLHLPTIVAPEGVPVVYDRE